MPHTGLMDASADPQWAPNTSVSFPPTDEEPSPSPAEGSVQSGVLAFEGQMLPGDVCPGLRGHEKFPPPARGQLGSWAGGVGGSTRPRTRGLTGFRVTLLLVSPGFFLLLSPLPHFPEGIWRD